MDLHQWEIEIAERADIRVDKQENLERGEGHTTMEGICLSITTTFGGIFIVILVILKTIYWVRDVFYDIKAPSELDNA